MVKSVRPNQERRLTDDVVLDRLILIMVNESARCMEEQVVQKVEHLDMAMILGTGFPPFRGGICAYADTRGLGFCLTRLNVLQDLFGSRFKPAAYLQKLVDQDQTFYTKKEGNL
jgi:3-hydroxyacyl-CoA dehydrogenase/enoyl-CoA hydratase/3-hydroxybutyryl-CoA epimerase